MVHIVSVTCSDAEETALMLASAIKNVELLAR